MKKQDNKELVLVKKVIQVVIKKVKTKKVLRAKSLKKTLQALAWVSIEAFFT